MGLSRRYLAEGEALLARGDRPQASEKLWGSVAEVVKAIAAEQGEHHRHGDLARAIERLITETGDVELGRLLQRRGAAPRQLRDGGVAEGLRGGLKAIKGGARKAAVALLAAAVIGRP